MIRNVFFDYSRDMPNIGKPCFCMVNAWFGNFASYSFFSRIFIDGVLQTNTGQDIQVTIQTKLGRVWFVYINISRNNNAFVIIKIIQLILELIEILA